MEDIIQKLERELQDKLKILEASSPAIIPNETNVAPPKLALSKNSNNQQQQSNTRRNKVRLVKQMKKGWHGSATSLVQLKNLMELRQSTKLDHKQTRDEAVAKYSSRADSLSNSLATIKKKYDEVEGNLKSRLGKLLEGLLIKVPVHEWNKRLDKPPKGVNKEVFSKETLKGGLPKICAVLSKLPSSGSDRKSGFKQYHGQPRTRQESRRLKKQSRNENRTRRREAHRETLAKSSILEMFPYLTLNQAKFALARCKDDVERTTNWLLSKDGSGLEWAREVQEPQEFSPNGDEPASTFVTLRILGASFEWIYCAGVLNENLASYRGSNVPVGYLQMSVCSDPTIFAGPKLYKKVNEEWKMPDLR
mmetsp:Transcript_360/g.924  ORF Transcript_360/g.924 Transcript_360/m.924 type:complete len:363 (+) Transcript_360:151-1239(+)